MEGLFRRGGVLWARLVVPERLRASAGRREFVKSTGAHDLAVGKLVASVLLAGWRRQLFELERGRVDDEQILRLVDGTPELAALGGHVSLAKAATLSGMDVLMLVRAAASGKLDLHCRLDRTSGQGILVRVEDLEFDNPEVGRAGGFVMPSMHSPSVAITNLSGQVLRVAESPDFASAILAGCLEGVEVVALEAPGLAETWFCPETSLLVAVGALEVSALAVDAIRVSAARAVQPERLERARRAPLSRRGGEGAAGGKWAEKRFTVALDVYCDDADGLPGDLRSVHEVRQRRGQMRMFADFMGDLRLCEIDGDTLRAYRDGPLKTIPGSINRLPGELQRDTIKATIEALREDGRAWPLLSDAVQHERMGHLAALFGWLDRKDYLKPNPAAGLRGETGMTKAERVDRARGEPDDDGGREFKNDQLKAIFGQLQFQVGHGRHVKKPAYWLPFEFWLPLMGLYGGVRIKEGAQLHLGDVKRANGVWVMDINEATADKSVKNSQSMRSIPVHPELMRLGFLAYCDRLRSEGFRRVFPELTCANSPAKYGKEPGRKMSAMLAGLGMPRDGTRVFHSLRHNCNNTMLRVPSAVFPDGGDELKRLARLRIMGHTVGDDVNTRHYTEAKPHELAALMAGVQFDLPAIAPFDIEFGLACVKGALNRKTGERHGTEDLGPLGHHVPGLAVA